MTRKPDTPAISTPAPNTATTAQGPGLQVSAGAVLSEFRRRRHSARTASNGSNVNPSARPARYTELEAKVRVMFPGSPGGTTHPCCQPLTVTGVSRTPLLVRASQPGLMLSGITSTREVDEAGARISRRAGPQVPVAAEAVAAPGNSVPAVSWAPSTVNAVPGLINNSCWPAGRVIGSGSQGIAATGSPSSSAPAVVRIEVCTNRPATAMTGPCSQWTATVREGVRAASGGGRGVR